MGNFSDYIKNNSNKKTQFNDTYKSEKTNKINQDELENMIEKYSNYSSNELMDEFLKITLEKKKNGNLSEEELSEFKNVVLPYLNEEQKQNLENLMSIVKNV